MVIFTFRNMFLEAKVTQCLDFSAAETVYAWIEEGCRSGNGFCYHVEHLFCLPPGVPPYCLAQLNL